MNKITLSDDQQPELLDAIHKRLLQVQIDLESLLKFDHLRPSQQRKLLNKYKVEIMK